MSFSRLARACIFELSTALAWTLLAKCVFSLAAQGSPYIEGEGTCAGCGSIYWMPETDGWLALAGGIVAARVMCRLEAARGADCSLICATLGTGVAAIALQRRHLGEMPTPLVDGFIFSMAVVATMEWWRLLHSLGARRLAAATAPLFIVAWYYCTHRLALGAYATELRLPWGHAEESLRAMQQDVHAPAFPLVLLGVLAFSWIWPCLAQKPEAVFVEPYQVRLSTLMLAVLMMGLWELTLGVANPRGTPYEQGRVVIVAGRLKAERCKLFRSAATRWLRGELAGTNGGVKACGAWLSDEGMNDLYQVSDQLDGGPECPRQYRGYYRAIWEHCGWASYSPAAGPGGIVLRCRVHL